MCCILLSALACSPETSRSLCGSKADQVQTLFKSFARDLEEADAVPACPTSPDTGTFECAWCFSRLPKDRVVFVLYA